MGNPYPASFENTQGARRLTGQIDFTDPANQPGGGSQPLAVTKYSFPFSFTVGGVPIQDDWLTFGTVAAGVVVVEVLGFVTSVWDAGGHLTVNDAPGGAGNNIYRTDSTLETIAADGFPAANQSTTISGNKFIQAAHFYAASTSLSVTTDAAALTGNFDLYLLTYTP